jgi:hypothetical protein
MHNESKNLDQNQHSHETHGGVTSHSKSHEHAHGIINNAAQMKSIAQMHHENGHLMKQNAVHEFNNAHTTEQKHAAMLKHTNAELHISTAKLAHAHAENAHHHGIGALEHANNHHEIRNNQQQFIHDTMSDANSLTAHAHVQHFNSMYQTHDAHQYERNATTPQHHEISNQMAMHTNQLNHSTQQLTSQALSGQQNANKLYHEYQVSSTHHELEPEFEDKNYVPGTKRKQKKQLPGRENKQKENPLWTEAMFKAYIPVLSRAGNMPKNTNNLEMMTYFRYSIINNQIEFFKKLMDFVDFSILDVYQLNLFQQNRTWTIMSVLVSRGFEKGLAMLLDRFHETSHQPFNLENKCIGDGHSEVDETPFEFAVRVQNVAMVTALMNAGANTKNMTEKKMQDIFDGKSPDPKREYRAKKEWGQNSTSDYIETIVSSNQPSRKKRNKIRDLFKYANE